VKLKLEHKGARIELIPLIDIIFLLLVFFIYSMLSMVVYRGIPVDLPAAETAETEQRDIIAITIDNQGRIYLDKELVSHVELRGRLENAVDAFPEKAVIISGHRDSPYRVFVDVLDQARLAGCQRVSIEAMPKEKRPKP
jgi:biopolymer transport protein ExbD